MSSISALLGASKLVDIDKLVPTGVHSLNEAKVKRYMRWIADGSMPPPLRGVALTEGRVAILDGHHRLEAAKRINLTQLRVRY